MRIMQVAGGSLILVLTMIALTWSAGAFAKTKIARENPPPGRLVEVGGYKMHVHCMGEGSPTVILEAGLDDFSIFWSSIMPEIAMDTRVCAYDRTGLGWSETSPNPRTSGTMVQELHALLVNAEVSAPYIMVGHSFGGALTRLYAHHYPDEVKGIVLVDAAPDDLFVRMPNWRNAIETKIRFFRTLAALSSSGLLAFAPGNIPNRGLPEEALAQYRAIAVSTDYFRTGIAESEMFESNLAEVRNAKISLHKLPLIVISRGYWEAMPGLSEAENQQAWQAWREMQVELLSLSSNSMQIVASKSEHNIHLQQPELVIRAIRELMGAIHKNSEWAHENTNDRTVQAIVGEMEGR